MSSRARIFHKLHDSYPIQEYDVLDVWAGNMSIELDGVLFEPTLARAFLGPSRLAVEACVRAELYFRDVDPASVREGDVEAHLWTDANEHGFVDERGVYHDSLGRSLAMKLVVAASGRPVPSGNNLVFESEAFPIEKTGVFHYTVEFSADQKPADDPSKAWISINDISHNRDGVIAVSPDHVRRCPSVIEVCVRKVGAEIRDEAFESGRFTAVTRSLEAMPTDVVYLLPFFEPGFGDLFTGDDVRKGELGSVYAVKDFFKIDPRLVTPLDEVDVLDLVARGLVRDFDLSDLLEGRQMARLRRVDDFNNFGTVEELVEWVGEERLTQIVGRAELRELCARAHELSKRVIFDLVLMQTSRDCPLIERHPEWYVLDEEGHPKIHQIAWLVYSDVALLDLPFNKPLQNYLSGVASFWIKTCDLDGVRIDASQTVDRPFLKQIKNRINQVRPDAVVLGETLCPLHEAVDIPTDMIHALLVDFHRDFEHAGPFIAFLEETFHTFAPGTVAMAYFENHDSPRATEVWRERYAEALDGHPKLRRLWEEREAEGDPAHVMALLKNIQASVIDATAGAGRLVNLAYAVEWGTTWGEEARTDFQNPTLLHPELAGSAPNRCLVQAYEALHALKADLGELSEGAVYFHRNEFEGGDPEDRVLAYSRYVDGSVLLVVHNLDPGHARRTHVRPSDLPDVLVSHLEVETLYDTYAFFFDGENDGSAVVDGDRISVSVEPLQTLVLRVRFDG
ncbi:MAG: alpha-amylase family glycosyl hydrolase [Candidatus Latescibacteria bacterium]|nr:alpha-amylase family glycosyl hydrolase [Candidatus Latescibacterota bacterium]